MLCACEHTYACVSPERIAHELHVYVELGGSSTCMCQYTICILYMYMHHHVISVTDSCNVVDKYRVFDLVLIWNIDIGVLTMFGQTVVLSNTEMSLLHAFTNTLAKFHHFHLH